ncbi:MAG TPA: hypothetical protein PKU97_16970, partial [Kofleriaceae bacterium]|nr:hypothetical protein [Kofleriaceae bacterium]
MISNVTGELAGEEVMTPAYWRRQLRSPVRFERGLRAAVEQTSTVFVELGPRPVLCALGLDALGAAYPFVPSQRGKGDGLGELASAAAALFVHGVEWRRPHAGAAPRKVALP